MIKIFFLFACTFLISGFYGQLLPCGQHTKLQEQLKDPDFKVQYESDQKIQELVMQQMLKDPALKRGTVYKIPVVFHVLHSNGPENISREQIVNQLGILNNDFRLLNADAKNVHPDFKTITADAEIEFVLATKAPNGACFSGITRTYTSKVTTDGAEQVKLIKSGNDVFKGEWTGYKYLNIFVSSGLNGPAGYAYKPFGNGNSMESGIYILHRYIGSIGTGNTITSRAFTHEVGHWLNLDHTWGPNNNPGDPTSCGTDDGVTDTPNCIGDKSICNLDDKFCGPRANVENFMEYSYCSKMFTQRQVERMRAALISPIGGRNKIISTSNLDVVGANNISKCNVDFTSNNTQTCEGGQVSFTDISYNAPVSWLWGFPGGTPSSSTSQNPTVIYPLIGNYSVKLTISDGISSQTIDKPNYILVVQGNKEIPFLETFRDSKLSDFWNVSNLGNNEAFELYQGAGFLDDKCLRLANYSSIINSTDYITSNCFDLTKIIDQGPVTLTFRYAYRKKSIDNSEVFKISMSGDCGSSWKMLRSFIGGNLSSSISQTNWFPSSISDWTTVHITNISNTYWNSNARIRFSFDGSGGNNFYLDDINLYAGSPSDKIVLSVKENKVEQTTDIYPNPCDLELIIPVSLKESMNGFYEVKDILGKTIIRCAINASTGNNLIIVPTNELIKGNYFIKIIFGEQQITREFQVR